MEKEDIIKQLQELVWDEFLIVHDITNINYKPHPYCIWPKHLEYNDSMYLWEASIKSMEREHWPMCAMYTDWRWKRYNAYSSSKWCTMKCNLKYEEHTSDKVVALKLKCNCKNEDIQPLMKSMVSILEENKIDWFVFVDTDEKFRCLN